MNSTLEIDPELTVIDAESARSSRRKHLEPVSVSRGHYDVLLAQSQPHLGETRKRLGYGDSSRQRRDILRAQSHLGPPLSLPARLTMLDDVVYRESIPGIITQILSQRPSPLMDRLSRR